MAQRALQGESVFISGPAGVGKSTTIRFVVQEFMRRGVAADDIFMTASTGVAAALVGGITIHSFAGIIAIN